jgi:hypothetical protein
MTREAAIQHRLYQSAMQGEVRAQIFLARRFEKFRGRNDKTLADLLDLFARLRKEKRDPTEQESLFMSIAQKQLHMEPTAEEREEIRREIRTFSRKQRRERKRKERERKRKEGSDKPGTKS